MGKDGWTTAPCKGCGCEIEDEGPVTDEGWWCSQCWPNEDRKRLRAKVAELESQIACTDIHTRISELETKVDELNMMNNSVETFRATETARADTAERDLAEIYDALGADDEHRTARDAVAFMRQTFHALEVGVEVVAQRDRRIAELEAGTLRDSRRISELEQIVQLIDRSNREHEDKMRGANDHTRSIRDLVIAALYPAPASPATATKMCGDCFEPLDRCGCNVKAIGEPKLLGSIPIDRVNLDNHNGDKK